MTRDIIVVTTGSIVSGMISTFNTASCAVGLVHSPEVTQNVPVAVDTSAIDTVTSPSVIEFFSQFGIPAGFAIIFGLLCVIGTIHVYRSMERSMQSKKDEINKLRDRIDDLNGQILKLTKSHTRLEVQKSFLTKDNKDDPSE